MLNSEVFERFRSRVSRNILLLSPIFAETEAPAGELDPVLAALFDARAQKLAVVYSSGRNSLNGMDVYGFPFVAKLLPELVVRGFHVLFRDPPGAYSTEELDPLKTGAITHYTKSVDFRALLSRTDVYLRPTSTDGNSVAVLEALASGVPVLASDAVPRPDGVTLYRYGSASEFLSCLDALFGRLNSDRRIAAKASLSSAKDYVEFVKSL